MKAWLAAALLLLVSCSNSTPDDGAPLGPTSACGQGWAADANGTCHQTCTADGDCPADQTCDTFFGLCRPEDSLPPMEPGPVVEPEEPQPPEQPGEPSEPTPDPPVMIGCQADDECAFGSRCEDGECVSILGDVLQTCEDDSQCGLLMTCQLGLCVGCIDDLQCGDGKCMFGTCVVADLGPAGECLTLQCSGEERCNPLTGTCEPLCEDDSECGEERICAPLLNQCIDEFGCETAEDCLTNLPLCVAGLCVGCLSDAECRPSESCVVAGGLGVCLPTFEQTAVCARVTCDADETCDPADGSCYPTNGTCEDDSDCREGQDCNFLRLCSGCAADGDCRSGQRCLFGTCLKIEQ